ncbi:hypothetical protein NDU88_005815 [Pleurodeles waltl]|uniref:Uncharacterized protein n=1 Tax=Pleurodeles waltl TaxID=8319 RepID=A0AAV7MC35_PLEWA|nr:hypothetical protein NDU88_005815 [Pleurodeles waltl]
MLTKTTGGPKGKKMEDECSLGAEELESPVTHSCMEALFASLRDNLQAAKRGLSSDLKELWRDLDEVGERVATVERKDVGCSKEIEHIDLQSHTQRTLKTAHSGIIS